MTTYQGVVDGPRDPNTPGPYCLSICWAGCCPQAAKQAAAVALLREQEWALRDRREGERAGWTPRHGRRQVAA